MNGFENRREKREHGKAIVMSRFKVTVGHCKVALMYASRS